MRRREFITLIGGLAIAWPIACYAQQPNEQPKRVGLLAGFATCALPPDNPVVRRLAELGWVERRNIVFECVSAVGRWDQVPALARELVSRRPDVMIAAPYTFVIALRQETTTIPIVMLGTLEPVRLGLITNLARPGGNITGVAWFSLLPKQIELLKEIVPNLMRVAYIGPVNVPPSPEEARIAEENRQIVASTLGLTWEVFQAAVENDFEEIFARLSSEHFDAAYIRSTAFIAYNAARSGQLALRYKIPTVSDARGQVAQGALLSYGQDFLATINRALEYVDNILRGAKPSNLPIEHPTKLELIINLKTAKELGLTVPPSLIARADEVIE
jgi:putative tryptophan/tyrosine transport system substrate-binding protein